MLWAKTEHGFDLSVEKNNLPRLRVAVSSTESLATLQAPPGEVSLPSCDRITFRMDNCQTWPERPGLMQFFSIVRIDHELLHIQR